MIKCIMDTFYVATWNSSNVNGVLHVNNTLGCSGKGIFVLVCLYRRVLKERVKTHLCFSHFSYYYFCFTLCMQHDNKYLYITMTCVTENLYQQHDNVMANTWRDDEIDGVC